MNVELLNKIKEHIRQEPKRWTYNWCSPSSESPCGTQTCIAGWAMVLSGKVNPHELLDHTWRMADAQEILGLDSKQADRLFIDWPEKNFEQMNMNKAETAIARIDFFLRTNGTDQENPNVTEG